MKLPPTRGGESLLRVRILAQPTVEFLASFRLRWACAEDESIQRVKRIDGDDARRKLARRMVIELVVFYALKETCVVRIGFIEPDVARCDNVVGADLDPRLNRRV